MNDSKNQWKVTLIEFICLFIIIEASILVGMYLIFNCFILNAVRLFSLSLMFEGVKESVQQVSFLSFLQSYKEVWLITSFFSLLLAGVSID